MIRRGEHCYDSDEDRDLTPVELPETLSARAVPSSQPARSKTPPNAMPEAMPEQKTKMSAGSENPNRAGTQLTQSLLGTCEMSMMSKTRPRKKSSRISRERTGAGLEGVTSFISDSESRRHIRRKRMARSWALANSPARSTKANYEIAMIYEADPSADARMQGGQLDIHEHNGQLALKEACLFDEFRTITHAAGEASPLLDQHGTALLDEPDDGKGGRPEVLRGDLRRILLPKR
jgi:hypothetical protein